MRLALSLTQRQLPSLQPKTPMQRTGSLKNI